MPGRDKVRGEYVIPIRILLVNLRVIRLRPCGEEKKRGGGGEREREKPPWPLLTKRGRKHRCLSKGAEENKQRMFRLCD